MRAIVLARRDFREYDQIISVYTKDFGKMELLARGVKKIISKQSAHLEPFSLVDIETAHGKEIDHLIKVQSQNVFKDIRSDLQKSLAAQYVVSLTDRLVQAGERDERIFNILQSSLHYVNLSIFQSFNLSLLDGYIVTLLHCLGFSILQSPDFAKWNDRLEIMEQGDWEAISQLLYDEQLHRKIYEFLVYQTERKVSDWAKICII